MVIKRTKRKTNFTIIGNTGLKDEQLSLRAKGLLAYMLSLPDDWEFYESELASHCTDGRDSIRKALKELESHNYLIKRRERDSKGRLRGTDWEISDMPVLSTFSPTTEKPTLVKPTLAKPTLVKPTLLSTNELSTNKQSTNYNLKPLSSSTRPRIPYSEIIEYLNQKTDSKYQSSSNATKRLIKARIDDGFDLGDFKKVIDNKTSEWKHTNMEKFLRPQTLFGTKFESYLNQKTLKHQNYNIDQSDRLPY